MTLASQLDLERARSAALWEALKRHLSLSAKRRRRTAQNGPETPRKRFLRCSCGCGKTFMRRRPNQRYFSAACRKRAWKLRKELAALRLEIRQGRGSDAVM